eukprot:SAG31_NODE_5012_length_2802_cov_1.688494_4_plen_58_part_00
MMCTCVHGGGNFSKLRSSTQEIKARALFQRQLMKLRTCVLFVPSRLFAARSVDFAAV